VILPFLVGKQDAAISRTIPKVVDRLLVQQMRVVLTRSSRPPYGFGFAVAAK
jgi:hypothetical protein